MLTDYEYTFIRSHIVVISDLSIQKIKSNLFLKLKVQKHLIPTQKSSECDLLFGISFTKEDIKTKTLELIEKRITSFQEISIKNENAIWEWYD